jgi:hypothetical protein
VLLGRIKVVKVLSKKKRKKNKIIRNKVSHYQEVRKLRCKRLRKNMQIKMKMKGK